jgi:3-methyl-2-oxobutanoate hydroxymethyltransferase
MNPSRVTVPKIRAAKGQGPPLTMVTAYDFTSARLADKAGVDLILVGDSASMVMLGHDSTLPVTLEEMLVYTRGASRGVETALVVGDLPFLSYGLSVGESVRSAGRLIQEGGAQAVKLEGGRAMAEHVARMVACGIPVMGHLGLTPQSVHKFGGHKVQGRSIEAVEGLLADARTLVEAGVFAIVLEGLPARVATTLTGAVPVPTIGIGAGAGCDGQVLVWQDLLGLNLSFSPRFVKRYARLEETVLEAVGRFCQEVRDGKFPSVEHSYELADPELEEWLSGLEAEAPDQP